MVIYPCVYGPKNSPRIQDSGKFLLVEFGTPWDLEFGIPLKIGIRNPSSTDKESRIWNFLGRQNVMQQAMRVKIVQFKLQWISPFWFQSIKTQIVHLWWSLNLCNYFEDYWCLIIKPIHFLSYRIKSDFISVDKIFLTLTCVILCITGIRR